MAKLTLVSDQTPRIDFPHWVQGPTLCKTRTFSLVLPGGFGYRQIKIVRALPNRPLVKRRQINPPKYYYGWAERERLAPHGGCNWDGCEICFPKGVMG